MKVFVQAKNESVVINDEITVTVIEVRDDEVVLAIDAPEWVEVCEEETLETLDSRRFAPADWNGSWLPGERFRQRALLPSRRAG